MVNGPLSRASMVNGAIEPGLNAQWRSVTRNRYDGYITFRFYNIRRWKAKFGRPLHAEGAHSKRNRFAKRRRSAARLWTDSDHYEATESDVAQEILQDYRSFLSKFWVVKPKASELGSLIASLRDAA